MEEHITSITFEMAVNDQLPTIVARHVTVPESMGINLGIEGVKGVLSVHMLAGVEELQMAVDAYNKGIEALEMRIKEKKSLLN